MDAGQLIEILRATIDPNQRENAEKQLEQVTEAEMALSMGPLNGAITGMA